MIQVPRLAIYVNDKCNLKCKYCCNKSVKRDFTLTKEFLTFLSNITIPYVVAICGKEPLFDFEKIVKIHEYVPKHIHKKVITNGTLLTSKMVDYFNDNEVEVAVSHDGETTETTRGINILKNKKICDLIKNIKNLTIQSVINTVSYNTSVISYIQDKLNRDDYVPLLFIDTVSSISILPFLYKHNLMFLPHKRRIDSPWYKNIFSKTKILPASIHYLPNGQVWTNDGSEYLCNCNDSMTELNTALLKSTCYSVCAKNISSCKYKNFCKLNSFLPTNLYCKYIEKLATGQLRRYRVL